MVEFRDLPAAHRIAAEVRYIRELERACGGPDKVARIYQAWIEASESEANQIGGETAALAVRWPSAADTAARAGFRDLGEVGETYFDVRLSPVGTEAQ
ncbi:MAG: hypothetical protein H7255_07415 [Ramlibacter sp.]|nr:hypothetical protein [Ramlibacter sp.]